MTTCFVLITPYEDVLRLHFGQQTLRNALLDTRVWQHKHDIMKGFTSRYGVHMLVWFETYGDIGLAIAREKQIKGWNRAWKIRLIEKGNP
jgi:predicted GIY-YIG superfamily endonuclease